MKKLVIFLVWLAWAGTAVAEDWVDFRGPTGQGHYAGKKLPTEWTTTKNVAWKRPIPGHGWSSPIVLKGRVYLSTAVPVAGSKDVSLAALCLDATSGEVHWQTEVFRQAALRIHIKNSHASPSPLTDGSRLYVHFGPQGTAALDFAGKVLWRNTELHYSPVHGAGGSPILAGERLVFSTDGADKQLLIGLECATGKVAWKTDRKCSFFKKFSFSTPLLIDVEGRPQIVSPSSGAVIAYDARDGAEAWRVTYDGYSLIPRPVFGHGLVFLSTGYDQPTLLAVRPTGAKGDVTDTHVVWTSAKGAPHTPSPLLVGDELYAISDSGIASCFDARTGKLHWQERIEGAYSASPLHAGGKIYLQSEDGVTTVLRAATKFERLAESRLEERTFASYAVADGAIYLRTETQLYRIEQK